MDLMTRLAACGLYQLRPEGQVAIEAEAMMAGLSLLSQRLIRCAQAGDPARMPRAQLLRMLCLYGLEAQSSDAATTLPQTSDAATDADALLRRAVTALMRLPWPRTLAEIEVLLNQLGAQLTLFERPHGKGLLVEGQMGGLLPDEQTILAFLGRCAPAGCAVAAAFGELVWEMIDQSEMSFAALDEADFTWAWFDLFGHRLFA